MNNSTVRSSTRPWYHYRYRVCHDVWQLRDTEAQGFNPSYVGCTTQTPILIRSRSFGIMFLVWCIACYNSRGPIIIFLPRGKDAILENLWPKSRPNGFCHCFMSSSIKYTSSTWLQQVYVDVVRDIQYSINKQVCTAYWHQDQKFRYGKLAIEAAGSASGLILTSGVKKTTTGKPWRSEYDLQVWFAYEIISPSPWTYDNSIRFPSQDLRHCPKPKFRQHLPSPIHIGQPGRRYSKLQNPWLGWEWYAKKSMKEQYIHK